MSQRVLKVGLVGGGGGGFIVNPHQKAIHMDGTRRDRLRGAPPGPQDRHGRGGQVAVPHPRLPVLRRDDRGGVAEAPGRADRLRPHRHAELRPLRPGHETGAGGHPGLLREAHHRRLQAGPGPGQGRREGQGPLRRRAHLCRPLVKLVRAVGRHERPAGPGPLGRCVLPPGLAGHARREGGRRRRVAHGPEEGRRELLRRRHRHPRVHATQVRHGPGGHERPRHDRDVPGRPPTRRPLHHLLRTLQRRPGHGPRQPDLHRPQERPGPGGELRARQPRLAAGGVGEGRHPPGRRAGARVLARRRAEERHVPEGRAGLAC